MTIQDFSKGFGSQPTAPLLVLFAITTCLAPQASMRTVEALIIGHATHLTGQLKGVPHKLTQERICRKNDSTADKVGLGRSLYFDKRLSADGTVSCATCHDPATAFASKDPVAVGVRNQLGTRNVPTLLNARFSKSYFWDGRALTLEEQAKQPLLKTAEMGMENEAALVERLSSITEYRRKFRRVFPREGITLEAVTRAIAAYERTLLYNNSPFDRFIAGDHKAISENQRKGWELFKGKAKCLECHAFSASSPFFIDFKFYNTGIAARGQNFDELLRRARKPGR